MADNDGRAQAEVEMSVFDEWHYTVDRDATIATYARAEDGGADRCDCNGCRNFRLARTRVYPSTFLALLDRLGIDPHKEAEAYHNARLAPGRHDYGGWFHFVGTLDETKEFAKIDLGAGFTTWLCRADAPRLPSFEGQRSLVQLEFHSDAVPWLLEEPEAD